MRVRLPLLAAVLIVAALLGIGSPVAAQTPKITLGGVVYSQYRYLLSDSTGHANDFDITRAYLNALGQFDHGVTTRVTADVYRPGNAPLAYRLKYAFFQWRPENAPVDMRFGLTMTPWIDWEEALWGYRMQGSTFLDRAGYLTSSDYGAALDFFSKDQGLNGSVAVVDGEGYGSPVGGKYVDLEARASYRLLKTDDMSRVGGLRLNAYGQLGQVDSTGYTRDRWILGASYRSSLLTLAAEYAWLVDGTAAQDNQGTGLSAYAVLNLPHSPAALIARLDRIDPSAGAGDARTDFIAGASYRLSSNVRLLGDVDLTGYEAAAPTPALAASRSKLLFQTEFAF